MEQPFLNAIYSNIHHKNFIMTFCAPELKAEYLTECLIEVVNNQWKVNAIESNRAAYHQLEMEVCRKYIKVWELFIRDGIKNDLDISRSCFMFIDKESGACYKPASFKAPAKGIRFQIEQLVDQPEIVDPYGSFLYVR